MASSSDNLAHQLQNPSADENFNSGRKKPDNILKFPGQNNKDDDEDNEDEEEDEESEGDEENDEQEASDNTNQSAQSRQSPRNYTPNTPLSAYGDQQQSLYQPDNQEHELDRLRNAKRLEQEKNSQSGQGNIDTSKLGGGVSGPNKKMVDDAANITGREAPLDDEQKQRQFDNASPAAQELMKEEGLAPKDKSENNNEEKKGDPQQDLKGGGKEADEGGKTPEAKPIPTNEENEDKKKNPAKNDQEDTANNDPNSKINEARNKKSKENSESEKSKEDKEDPAKKLTSAGVKQASAVSLTTFWGSVWLDWTFLSLLYLNGHLVVANVFPNWVCDFGDDYLIGKWMPKELAKWIEIILLALLDVIVASIFAAIIYGGYQFVNGNWTYWDVVKGGTKGIISGEGVKAGVATEVIKKATGQ
ncbi:MAG: hypothetical protein WCP18_00160 [bacterium]